MNRLTEQFLRNPPLLPFLKWAGGKRWLSERYPHLFATSFDRFVEPFLGGGAVFFRLMPQAAILSDCNARLIEAYVAIRDNWRLVRRLLREHEQQHSRSYYYRLRSVRPRSTFARAAQLIYLNRTCWNGLYRVNLRGAFNVPIGTKSKVLLPTDDFARTSALLRTAQLRSCDFAETLSCTRTGDFVFIDPPYTVKHDHNGFIKYNEGLFTWQDQIRLCDAVKAAVGRGAKVLVTNAHHSSVRELYRGVGEHITLCRPSVIAGNSRARGLSNELAIKCF